MRELLSKFCYFIEAPYHLLCICVLGTLIQKMPAILVARYYLFKKPIDSILSIFYISAANSVSRYGTPLVMRPS